MSNPDSFIQEVTEEVRRDRLFRAFRRFGWIPALLIVGLVGGAAYVEWRKAQDLALAQAFGDAVLAALDTPQAADRTAALAQVQPQTDAQRMILALVKAAEAITRDTPDPATAIATWTDLAARADVPELYRHLALLKAHLAGGTGDAARDAQVLTRLATPGAPFRPLAIEQQALAALAAGDTEGAIQLMRDAIEAPGATEVLRQRGQQLITALGGSPDPV